jgi:hypothetical protein
VCEPFGLVVMALLQVKIGEAIERCCGLIYRIINALPGDHRPCSEFIEKQSTLQEF